MLPKKAYDEEEEESDEEDIEEKALGSDEDEVDEEGASYLEMLEGESDGSVDDDDDEIDEETTLEAFDTEMDKSDCDMDEYVTFYRVMTELESGDPNWYNQLIGHLTEPQQKELKEVVNTALKCMQQKGVLFFLPWFTADNCLVPDVCMLSEKQ
ncbi:putative importin 7 [Fasciola hepatica]|uniref:Importin 7 n=1 Tax=Fasciola hepatica TaxID=6192 RepID=A0A4E0QXE9_FASHE|nr:putative importin 7 [Fasciola hepatica]